MCSSLITNLLIAIHRDEIYSLSGVEGIVNCLLAERVEEPALWCLARLSQDDMSRSNYIPNSIGAIEGLVRLMFNDNQALKVPAALTLTNLKSFGIYQIL